MHVIVNEQLWQEKRRNGEGGRRERDREKEREREREKERERERVREMRNYRANEII